MFLELFLKTHSANLIAVLFDHQYLLIKEADLVDVLRGDNY